MHSCIVYTIKLRKRTKGMNWGPSWRVKWHIFSSTKELPNIIMHSWLSCIYTMIDKRKKGGQTITIMESHMKEKTSKREWWNRCIHHPLSSKWDHLHKPIMVIRCETPNRAFLTLFRPTNKGHQKVIGRQSQSLPKENKGLDTTLCSWVEPLALT